MKSSQTQSKTSANILLASAMALPAYANAANMPEKESFSYRYSQYTEDAADESKVVDGDLERFEINVHQFKLLKFIGEDSTLTVSAMLRISNKLFQGNLEGRTADLRLLGT